MKDYFLVTSSGAAATRWLAAILNQHPDIVCSCGSGTVQESMVYDRHPTAEDTERIGRFLLEHCIASHAEPRSIDAMFDELETVREARFYGNVHGETVHTYAANLQRFQPRRTWQVVNLVRHPITRTESKFNILRSDVQSSPSMARVAELQWKDRLNRLAPFAASLLDQIGDYHKDPLRCLFLNALMDTLGGLSDFNTPAISDRITHYKIEEVKKDEDRFRCLVREITGGRLELGQDFVERALSPAQSNAHRYRVGPESAVLPKDAEAQWRAWEDWQREAFQLAMETASLHAPYVRLGYSFDFVGVKPAPRFPGLSRTRNSGACENRAQPVLAPSCFNQVPETEKPVSPEVLNQMEIGHRYLREGETEIAEMAFKRALSIDPCYAPASMVLEQMARRKTSAMARRESSWVRQPFAQSAVRAEDGAASSFFALGHELRRKGNHPLAMEADATAMPKLQGHVSRLAMELLSAAESARMAGKGKSALDYLRLATRWSTDPEVLDRAEKEMAAFTSNRDLHTDEALQCSLEWVQESPQDPTPWSFSAVFLDACGAKVRALQARIRASQLRAEPESARSSLMSQVQSAQTDTGHLSNLIFFNITNSGASALDPILRALFITDLHWDSLGGPNATAALRSLFPGTVPFYHWTHSGPAAFPLSILNASTKVLCLYRDPRDILVSHSRDPLYAEGWKQFTQQQVIEGLITHNFVQFFAAANQWIQRGSTQVMHFRFEDMKQDIPGLVRRIVEFTGVSSRVAEQRIDALCEEYSFERQSGRKRGSDGPTTRTGYMIRKGASGEWRSVFDQKLARHFVKHCGDFLIDWGYETNHDWVNSLPENRDAESGRVGSAQRVAVLEAKSH